MKTAKKYIDQNVENMKQALYEKNAIPLICVAVKENEDIIGVSAISFSEQILILEQLLETTKAAAQKQDN